MFKNNSGSSSSMLQVRELPQRAIFDAPVSQPSMAGTYAAYVLLGLACALPVLAIMYVL